MSVGVLAWVISGGVLCASPIAVGQAEVRGAFVLPRDTFQSSGDAEASGEVGAAAQRRMRDVIGRVLDAEDAGGTDAAAMATMMMLLDSADHRVRRAAEGELGRSGFTPERLIEMAGSAGSAQVRFALLDAARERFLDQGRAGLGIGIMNGNGLPIVQNLIAGFPAGEKGQIRAGDRIVSIGGYSTRSSALSTTARLRAGIMSYRPGDVATFVIDRPVRPAGAVADPPGPMDNNVRQQADLSAWWYSAPAGLNRIEVEVEFGAFESLQNIRGAGGAVMRSAFDALVERVGGVGYDAEVRSGVPAAVAVALGGRGVWENAALEASAGLGFERRMIFQQQRGGDGRAVRIVDGRRVVERAELEAPDPRMVGTVELRWLGPGGEGGSERRSSLDVGRALEALARSRTAAEDLAARASGDETAGVGLETVEMLGAEARAALARVAAAAREAVIVDRFRGNDGDDEGGR